MSLSMEDLVNSIIEDKHREAMRQAIIQEAIKNEAAKNHKKTIIGQLIDLLRDAVLVPSMGIMRFVRQVFYRSAQDGIKPSDQVTHIAEVVPDEDYQLQEYIAALRAKPIHEKYRLYAQIAEGNMLADVESKAKQEQEKQVAWHY